MIPGRNQQDFTNKIVNQMARENLDAIILTSPDAIFYATGYASSFLYHSFNYGLTVLVVNKDGKMAMILSEFEKQAAARSTENIEFIAYPTWIYIEDYAIAGQKKEVQPDVNKSFKEALKWIEANTAGGIEEKRIGVQYDSIKFLTWEYLCEQIKRENLIDLKEFLISIRTIKTKWEIDVIREATQISEKAMLRTAKETVAGMTDTEVTNLFRMYCLEQSQEIVEVTQDHTFGTNFAPSRILSGKVLENGDVIRLDGGPKLSGYNSDIARTYAVGGKASGDKERIYECLWKGRKAAESILAPQVPRSQVFQAMQDAIHKAGLPEYIRGHHGHSLGCSTFGEEYPFIAPDDNRPFEPGMIFCLEVPYYSSKHHSYNIEDTFLVTETGIEFFSHARESLDFSS